MSIPDDVLEYGVNELIKNMGNEGTSVTLYYQALSEDYNDPERRAMWIEQGVFPPDDAGAVVQITYPQNFIADASELKRKFPLVQIDGGIWDIEKMGVSIKMTAFNDGETIESDPLNEFDALVYQSICSYIDRGIGNTDLDIESELRFFTPAMIYENMNPGTVDSNAKQDLIEKVRISIDKMRHIKVTLNYNGFIEKVYKGRKQAAQREGFLKESLIEDEWLINAKRTPFKLNGQWVDGYRMNTVPPIYWKQKTMVKQLATYERKLLNPPGMRDNTGELLLIKHFILEYIQNMKSMPKLTKKLKYDTIFSKAGIVPEALTKRQRQTKREQIRKYLDFLISEQKIKGYSEYKIGQKIAGIQFKL